MARYHLPRLRRPRRAARGCRHHRAARASAATTRSTPAPGRWRVQLDPALRTLDGASLAHEQLWAFRRLLEAKSEQRPVLIAIDDMHRAGDKMIELLAELMARVVEVPVMLVLAGRPDRRMAGPLPGRVDGPREPARPRRCDGAGQRARSRASRSAPSAAAALVDRAGGNPLYVRELIAMVQHQGGLVADDGHYELAAGPGAARRASRPSSPRALDALGATEKTAVQHVAVLGNRATDAQVERLGLGRGRPDARAARRGRTPAPGPRRPLRRRRSAPARGGLRDPATRRARRAPPSGRRRRSRRSRTRPAISTGPPATDPTTKRSCARPPKLWARPDMQLLRDHRPADGDPPVAARHRARLPRAARRCCTWLASTPSSHATPTRWRVLELVPEGHRRRRRSTPSARTRSAWAMEPRAPEAALVGSRRRRGALGRAR